MKIYGYILTKNNEEKIIKLTEINSNKNFSIINLLNKIDEFKPNYSKIYSVMLIADKNISFFKIDKPLTDDIKEKFYTFKYYEELNNEV